MSGRVQFREDEGTIEFVEPQGFNPNDLARRLFEAEVRRVRADARMDRLKARGFQLPRRTSEMIRKDRDAR